MRCQRPHCGGLVRDPSDDLGKRCIACGRSPLPPPTEAELLAAGIPQALAPPLKGETSGRHGRGKEYTPAPLRLTHPMHSA